MIPVSQCHVVATNPSSGVVLLQFPNSFDMNWSLFRPQEFYESANDSFRGKYFSVSAYMRWYAMNEHKRKKKSPNATGFDYLDRVLGLNIPGDIFINFFDVFGEADDIRPQEQEVYDKVACVLEVDDLRDTDFYVIAYYQGSGDSSVLDHELAHARFALDPKYRADATRIVKENWSPALEKAMRKRGYGDNVLVDEAHAFSLTQWGKWFPWYLRDKQARKMRREIRKALL